MKPHEHNTFIKTTQYDDGTEQDFLVTEKLARDPRRGTCGYRYIKIPRNGRMPKKFRHKHVTVVASVRAVGPERQTVSEAASTPCPPTE